MNKEAVGFVYRCELAASLYIIRDFDIVFLNTFVQVFMGEFLIALKANIIHPWKFEPDGGMVGRHTERFIVFSVFGV